MTPSTSIDEESNTVSKNLLNNNNIEFSELNVKTENDMVLSGPESGIASGEEVTETDSSPAQSSKEGSPITHENDIAPPSNNDLLQVPNILGAATISMGYWCLIRIFRTVTLISFFG
ncbi:unnamed protein product [Cylicostephanus goldi]|uniref:Uncharacterized protein n=1 Tax=Cylicostephanus goldi TaxID=71465 RepID=A0A3P6QL22_CYLGO|nr:unnamed protein product [Cylicostephanus goldi]